MALADNRSCEHAFSMTLVPTQDAMGQKKAEVKATEKPC
jgi:hypothetical protein